MHLYTTKYTLKLEQKAFKIYRKFPIYIGSFRYIYSTKYTLSWNKKRLQNKSEISDLFCRVFCSNLQCIFVVRCYKKGFFPNGAPIVVWKNILYFVTLCDKYTVSWINKAYIKFPTDLANFFVPTYTVYVAKCSKINNTGWAVNRAPKHLKQSDQLLSTYAQTMLHYILQKNPYFTPKGRGNISPRRFYIV